MSRCDICHDGLYLKAGQSCFDCGRTARFGEGSDSSATLGYLALALIALGILAVVVGL